MTSIAIITFGICLVFCSIIIAAAKIRANRDNIVDKSKVFTLINAILKFQEEFNYTYENTQVCFKVLDDGTPVIEIIDVEETNSYGE